MVLTSIEIFRFPDQTKIGFGTILTLLLLTPRLIASQSIKNHELGPRSHLMLRISCPTTQVIEENKNIDLRRN